LNTPPVRSIHKYFNPAQYTRWLLAFLLICLVAAGCTPDPGAAQKTSPEITGKLADVLERGVLVIATDADYPPQSRLNAGIERAAGSHCDLTHYTANQLEGFDVEVAVEIARRLEVEPCFITPTWSQIVAGNWGDRWDISVGSMVITPPRMEDLYFSQPYISGQAVLFIHKDNQAYQDIADLSGKKIGVCTGCAYEAYLNGTLVIPTEQIDFKIKDAQIFGYDTDTSALADLAAGDGLRLDGVLTDPDTGRQAVESGLPLRQLGGAVYHDYSGVAIDKSSVSDPIPLVERITAIIQAMHADGTLEKVSRLYYNGDFTSPAAIFDIQALGQIP